MAMFQPGDRVRYVGPTTNRDCDATVEQHDDTPPGKLSLRLGNGARFFADPADCQKPR